MLIQYTRRVRKVDICPIFKEETMVGEKRNLKANKIQQDFIIVSRAGNKTSNLTRSKYRTEPQD